MLRTRRIFVYPRADAIPHYIAHTNRKPILPFKLRLPITETQARRKLPRPNRVGASQAYTRF